MVRHVTAYVSVPWMVWAFIGFNLLTACGYQLAGRGELPGGIQTLAVKVLDNRSSETGAETIVTNALVNELNRRRPKSVVSVDKADAVLTGTIQSIRWGTVTRSGINTASERRVHAKVSLALTDVSGNVLWKRSGIKAAEAYAVDADNKTATESSRRRAISALSEKMAEYVYRRLTDNF